MTEVHAFPETKMKQLLFPSLLSQSTDKENTFQTAPVLSDSSSANFADNNPNAGPSAAKQHKSNVLSNPSEKARLKPMKDKKKLLKRL